MSYTTIKKGYRLSVESWENDADNYKTKIVEGLSLPQVKLLVELARMHKSGSNGSHYFGNMCEPNRAERTVHVEAVRELFKKHPVEAWPSNAADCIDSPVFSDVVSDLLCDLLGHSEYYYTRVYSSHVVEFIPEDILIEDVTKTLDSRTE